MGSVLIGWPGGSAGCMRGVLGRWLRTKSTVKAGAETVRVPLAEDHREPFLLFTVRSCMSIGALG